MFEYLWRVWTHEKNREPRKRRTHRLLTPQLEALEDRCLLSPAISQFPIPTSSSSPMGIAMDSSGDLWFTEFKANNIAEIDATTHAVSTYSIPTATSQPFGIAAGPDGNLWFTEFGGNQIGMINPTTGAITQYPLPTAGSQPFGITAGPDGNLWFTESRGNQIGMINPTTHAISEYALPTANSSPAGITAGPDGNLWFAENGSSQIGVINPTTAAIQEYATPTSASGPLAVAAGSDGNLWFTENNTNQLGLISPSARTVGEVALASTTTSPFWIAGGPNGNLWFTEMNTNQVGEVNPADGYITQFTSAGSPAGITAGSGGTLWFTESTGNQIGEVFVPPTITTNPTSQAIDAGQNVTFTASPGNATAANVQWQVSGNGGQTFTPLSDDAIYAGVTTDQLSITAASTAMSGDEYEAVFSNTLNANATATTNAATLTVSPDLSLPASIPQGTAGIDYKHSFMVSGGVRPLSTLSVTNFTDNGTGLTAGAVTARAGAITINGLPSAAGTATFTVNVTDATGAGLTRTFTITINPTPTIGPLTVTQWTAGRSGFAGTLTITGGAQPFTIIGFSGLPTGLAPRIIGATVAFTGAPSVAQTFGKGSITVKDASGEKVTQTFSIKINPALAIGTLTKSQWTAGSPGFTGSMSVGGGTGAIIITHASGLPTGLNAIVNGGAISFTGVPGAAGTFANVSITIQDSVGANLTKTISITIHPAPTVSTLTETQWTVDRPGFNGAMTISGGTGPFSLTNSSGLPPGLTVILKGRTISFAGVPAAAATANGSVTIQDAAGATVTANFSITINPIAVVSDPTVTTWTAKRPGFSGTMASTGGTGPFQLTSVKGLPPGLTAGVSGDTIHLTGTPGTSGTFAGSITIRDAAGMSVATTFTIVVNPPPSVTGLTQTEWTVYQPDFPGTMTVSGGTGSLTIAHAKGLPRGLTATLTGSTISFTGVPTSTGSFTGSITIEDSVGASVTRSFGLTIHA
jgi:streptogramin lyase